MRIWHRKSKNLAAALAALLMTCGAGSRGGAAEPQPPPLPQARAIPTPAAEAPAANPADAGSIDAILHATYETISGPAGQQRDWGRFRSLFVVGARLIPVVPNPAGRFRTLLISADEYVQRDDPYFKKNGFFEREVARRTERFANMAQVFSTYESRHAAADTKPFERGINSFQLMNDGHRWWIVNILWQGETAENPIPKEYLPRDGDSH